MTETSPGRVRGRRAPGLARTSAARRARSSDSQVQDPSARDIPVG